MANVFGMNSSSYDKATSSPLPISQLVRAQSESASNKRAKVVLKQSNLWGWATSATSKSPGQETVATAAESVTSSNAPLQKVLQLQVVIIMQVMMLKNSQLKFFLDRQSLHKK